MMLEKIQKHIEERNCIIKELKKIIGYCDSSEINIDLDCKWSIEEDSLWISEDGKPFKDDGYNCIPYTISSFKNKGKKLVMAEKDSITYVQIYPEYEKWYNTTILLLSNNNKIER